VADHAILSPEGPSTSKSFTFTARLVFTIALVVVELIVLSLLVDTANLRVTTGFSGFLADWGPTAVRALLLGLMLSGIFAYFSCGPIWRDITGRTRAPWVSRKGLVIHVCALAVFSVAALRLFNPRTSESGAGVLGVACAIGGLATLISSAFVALPFEFWTGFFRKGRLAPVYGFSVAAATLWLVQASHLIWHPWMRATFSVVYLALKWLRFDLVANPATFTIGTKSFSVTISSACSGYEGVALMLLFGCVWLWLFRREFRFPQAFLLVPLGMVAMWVLNAFRILVLILIGDAGASTVALGGFHSQAGWIAFLSMALAFALVCQRVPWFASSAGESSGAVPAKRVDQAPAYIVPFLAILAAGMVASAASSGFEWGYGLRVICAAAALWYFRSAYSQLNWRIGWEAPAVGAAVFVIWIAAERFAPHIASLPMPPALSMATAPVRIAWLLLRIAGAIVTVPIAEELAFRGYVLRRLKSADFESVDLRSFSLIPLVLSSLMFGVLHGQRWIAGTIAGMLYAMVMRRRGSLGDAIVAHATTNALIAALVLSGGSWSLW